MYFAPTKMKKKPKTVENPKWLQTLFLLGLLAGGCMCFWNSLQDATMLPRVFFTAVWLLIFLPVVYRLFRNAEWSFNLTDAAFFLYFLFYLISTVPAINKPESVYETEKIFLSFFCYLVFRISLQQKIITEQLLLKTIAIVCSFYFLFSFLQLLNLIRLGKASGDNLYAVTGLAGHKNLYSGLLLLTNFLFVILALSTTGFWKKISVTLVVVQMGMIFILQTRSVFLALVVSFLIGVTISVWTLGKKSIPIINKAALPLLGILVLVFIFFALSGNLHSFLERFNVLKYAESATGAERRFVWYKCRMMLHDHWMWGVGARNWMLVYPGYSLNGLFRSQYLNTYFIQPHNDFLWVWCELGVLGLLSFLTLFGSLIFDLIKKISTEKELIQQLILLLFVTQLIGFLVFSYFDFPKERMEFQMLLAVSWAMISFRCGRLLKPFEWKKRYSTAFLISSYFLIAASAVGLFYRIKSDALVKELLAAKEQNDSKSVLLLAQMMQNPFSNLTPLAVPHKWYEGVAAYELKQYDLAYNCFSIAKTQAPYNHNVLNNLGALEGFYKHYDKALEHFHESLRIDNKNDDTRFNVAYMLYQLKRYDEAIDTVSLVWSNEKRKEEFIQVISASRDSFNK